MNFLFQLHLLARRLLLRLQSRKGQTLVEYGLILVLVSIVVVAVLSLLGNQIKTLFSSITSTLNSATSS